MALSLSLNHITVGDQMHFLSLEVRTLYFVREDINNAKKKSKPYCPCWFENYILTVMSWFLIKIII